MVIQRAEVSAGVRCDEWSRAARGVAPCGAPSSSARTTPSRRKFSTPPAGEGDDQLVATGHTCEPLGAYVPRARWPPSSPFTKALRAGAAPAEDGPGALRRPPRPATAMPPRAARPSPPPERPGNPYRPDRPPTAVIG